MRTLLAVTVCSALAVACNKKTEEAAPTPSAVASAPAPSAAAPAPSDSIPPLASAAPSAVPNIPTEEAYEQKAQTAISSTAAAEAELKKLEQEIGK